MGVTLPHELARGLAAPAQKQEGGSYVPGPCLPGLTMATKKGRRDQSTDRCNPLWKESEMGSQRRSGARM